MNMFKRHPEKYINPRLYAGDMYDWIRFEDEKHEHTTLIRDIMIRQANEDFVKLDSVMPSATITVDFDQLNFFNRVVLGRGEEDVDDVFIDYLKPGINEDVINLKNIGKLFKIDDGGGSVVGVLSTFDSKSVTFQVISQDRGNFSLVPVTYQCPDNDKDDLSYPKIYPVAFVKDVKEE